MISMLKTMKKIMMEMIPKTKKMIIRTKMMTMTRMTRTMTTTIAIPMEITTTIMMKKMMTKKVTVMMMKRRMAITRKTSCSLSVTSLFLRR